MILTRRAMRPSVLVSVFAPLLRVKSYVLAVSQKFQVLRPVVVLETVPVVDDLRGLKQPAEDLLHDQTVLKKGTTGSGIRMLWHTDGDVSLRSANSTASLLDGSLSGLSSQPCRERRVSHPLVRLLAESITQVWPLHADLGDLRHPLTPRRIGRSSPRGLQVVGLPFGISRSATRRARTGGITAGSPFDWLTAAARARGSL